MSRPSFEEYFGKMAVLVSERATCKRASVGAVLVLNNRVLTTGYNGAPSGMPECISVGCHVVDDHCLRSIHAETNAIADAARRGVPVEGATLYYYDSQQREPCQGCLLVSLAAGVVQIHKVSPEGYITSSWFTKELFSHRLIDDSDEGRYLTTP